MKIIDRTVDPIFIESAYTPNQMTLRIGEPLPGQTRTPMLSAGEARILAFALLLAAERMEAGQSPTPN